jgi:sec-independent protein translocase protein TatB
MFGIGGSEVIVILIVALIFLGPDKLPGAAKQASKVIRDLKKGSRQLTETIEKDKNIGGAIRDIRSALRGEEAPPDPVRRKKKRKPAAVGNELPPASGEVEAKATEDRLTSESPSVETAEGLPAADAPVAPVATSDAAPAALPEPKRPVRLPPTAGETDHDSPTPGASDEDELAALIRPAGGTVSRSRGPEN